MIPIYIKTFNRPYELLTTLDSLLASDIGDSKIHIIDDQSTGIQKQILENTQKENNIETLFPPAGLDTILGYSPPVISYVPAFPENVTVEINSEKTGIISSHFMAIKKGFETYPESEYIIFIEDDCVFSPDWKNRFHEAYENIKETGEKIGFVSAYDRLARPGKLGKLPPKKESVSGFRQVPVITADTKWRYVTNITSGGVCYLIARDFYNDSKCLPQMINVMPEMNGGDALLQIMAFDLGYSCWQLECSLCQHIGIMTTNSPLHLGVTNRISTSFDGHIAKGSILRT